MSDDTEIIAQLLAATAEVIGADLSPAALAVMADDLSQYGAEVVAQALMRYRREARGRMVTADILDRIREQLQHLPADEAWALAIRAADEADTIVWTAEMAQAWGVARPIYTAGDEVGARMAFRQVYQRLVGEALERGEKARWQVSLGHDPDLRREAVERAVESGKLAREYASALLPAPLSHDNVVAGLLAGSSISAPENAREALQKLRELIASGRRPLE